MNLNFCERNTSRILFIICTCLLNLSYQQDGDELLFSINPISKINLGNYIKL